jgi:ABC-type bacteriocin/lantibiotic exporter with double-glycine peptidase domain
MVRIPFFKQETCWTCGPASMRMVLAALGIKKSEKQVVKLLSANKVRGTWAKSFPSLAEKYKLNYLVKRNASIEELRKLLKEGYIVLTAYYVPKEKVDHYVVVKKIDKEYIHFLDPFYGPEHKYKLTYFRKIWKTDPKYDSEIGWFIGFKKVKN